MQAAQERKKIRGKEKRETGLSEGGRRREETRAAAGRCAKEDRPCEEDGSAGFAATAKNLRGEDRERKAYDGWEKRADGAAGAGICGRHQRAYAAIWQRSDKTATAQKNG